MISRLDAEEWATEPTAPLEAPVPWGTPTSRAPDGFFRLDALPAMTRGLCALAAIWAGLALFVSAFAFYAETNAELVLALVGGWLLAAGTAYVIADAPAAQQNGFA